MCIIALKPAGISIPESSLKNMWDNNDDGAGLMYADRGHVRVVKGLMKFEDFLSAYKSVGEHRKIVMHFRIKTHGAVSAELTHPFWIRKGDLAMVHNGVISSVGSTISSYNGTESDTSLYAKILSHRYPDPREALENEEEIKRIVSEIGWSKLVFLDSDGEHVIVNEKSGDWVDGCWFSNGSHKTSYRNFKSYSYYGDWESTEWAGGATSGNYKPKTYVSNPQTHYTGSATTPAWGVNTSPTSKYELAVVGQEEPEDDEWQRLIARYEAKYGANAD
jgi:predicted glutamine amidotransferase